MLVAVFDTETTGIPKHPMASDSVQPRCIEFAGVLADLSGEIHDELELLFDPGQKLEPIITKITGLTDKDLMGKPQFREAIPVLRSFFERAGAVIAHNLPFDTTIVDLEMTRAKEEPMAWPRIQICTVQENAEQWGRRPKLTEMYELLFKKPLEQKHRALDDVEQLLAVCEESGVLNDINEARRRTANQ